MLEKRKAKKQNKERGYTLIEILIAVVILTCATLITMELFPAGFKLNTKSRNFSKAIFLAQGKMEELIREPASINTIGSGVFSGLFSRYKYSYSKESYVQDPNFSVLKVTVTGPGQEQSVLCTLIKGDTEIEGIDADIGATVIWVVDRRKSGLQCFDIENNSFSPLTNLKDENGNTVFPGDVAVDGGADTIFVLDRSSKKIAYNTINNINNGNPWKIIASPGGEWEPVAIDSDFGGTIWVADQKNKRLCRWNGSAWNYYALPDNGIPIDVAVNAFGDIVWVSDKENKKILGLFYNGTWSSDNKQNLPNNGIPGTISTDAAGQKVYVLNTSESRIDIFESNENSWSSRSVPISVVRAGLATTDLGATVLWINDISVRKLKYYDLSSGDITGTYTDSY